MKSEFCICLPCLFVYTIYKKIIINYPIFILASEIYKSSFKKFLNVKVQNLYTQAKYANGYKYTNHNLHTKQNYSCGAQLSKL